jgi:hypothetical protein
VVALGGRLALAAEHLGRQQERAAVDGRLVQVLAERDRGAVQDLHLAAFPPGSAAGSGIDQHGRLSGPKQPVQRPLGEEVVSGEQHKQCLTRHRGLDGGQ